MMKDTVKDSLKSKHPINDKGNMSVKTEQAYCKDTLDNGLRVITAPMGGARSVTVMILVPAGSRAEERRINGISHFMEHMFFKGARRYPDAMAVASAIDSVGGVFNAFTGEETVAYFVKLSSARVEVACDVLSDMLLHSKFDRQEIDRERGVIIEEIRMYNDDPMSRVQMDFKEWFFGDQPLGWDIAGTEENIRAFTRDDFLEFRKARYTADNIVLAAAGDITRDGALGLAERFFKGAEPGPRPPIEPYRPMDGPRSRLRRRDIEQAHFVLGFPIPGDEDAAQPALKVLSNILGGTMSSRLFHEIRERRGLAYYIRSARQAFTDTGVLSVSAGINVDKLEEAIAVTMEQIVKMAEKGVTDEELSRGRENIKGKNDLSMENSMSLATLLAAREALYGKVKTPEEINAEIDAVELADVNEAARRFLVPEKVRMAVLGPYDGVERFDARLGSPL